MDALRRDHFSVAGAAVLTTVLIAWFVLSFIAVARQGTWPDEVGYVIKSWWYISGAVRPYTAEDATWYQPLLFYWLGAWQLIAGHDIVASRALSLFITAIDIVLLAAFLRRLGCTVWPIALAVIVYTLTEDSIFYFSSAAPYTYSICLQLVALHLMLSMDKRACFRQALGLGFILTMIYLLRINLISFVALSLAIVWVRAGRDRWRVYLVVASIFLVSWGMLAWLWGSRFIYVSLWVPIVTDALVHVGILPRLFPYAFTFSHQVIFEQQHKTLADLLAYAFGWEMWRDWMLGHHLVPMAAVVLATLITFMYRIVNRGWILLFVATYCGMLLFHHLGAQSYCPICIQAYANYFDYFGALAIGLALHGLLQRFSFALPICVITAGMVFAALVAAAVQSWSLTGVNKLPSIRNSLDALPQEVKDTRNVLGQWLKPGSSLGIVGTDPRIPLALEGANIRVPPINLSLLSSYRELDPKLTAEQEARTVEELRELTSWTDAIAKTWMENDYDWLIVQRQPAKFPSWLIWSPEAPLIKTGIEKCFIRTAVHAFDAFSPPLAIELYKRVHSGSSCVGE